MFICQETTLDPQTSCRVNHSALVDVVAQDLVWMGSSLSPKPENSSDSLLSWKWTDHYWSKLNVIARVVLVLASRVWTCDVLVRQNRLLKLWQFSYATLFAFLHWFSRFLVRTRRLTTVLVAVRQLKFFKLKLILEVAHRGRSGLTFLLKFAVVAINFCAEASVIDCLNRSAI
jgi:hypothetical protein